MMSMTAIFGIVAGIAVLLTFLARNTHDILLRIGASLCWLAMLVYLLVGGDATLDIGETWVQVLAFALFVMIVVPLLWQIRTETKREASYRDKLGRTQSITYSAFERKPKNKKPTSAERQTAYREKVRGSDKKQKGGR